MYAYNVGMNAPDKATVPTPNVPNMPLVDLAITTLNGFAETAATVLPIAEFGEGNVSALIEAARPNHAKWGEVISLREQIDTIIAAIDEDNSESIVTPTAEDITAAKAKFAEIKAQAESVFPVLKQFVGNDWADSVPNIFRPKSKSKSSTAVTDQKRPRLAKLTVSNLKDGTLIWEGTGDNEDPSSRATFTNAARVISKDSGTKVEVSFLQDHAFTVAGTKDLSTVKDSFEFGVTVEDKHYNLSVEPKA